MTSERKTLVVTMEVTASQALALQAMFNHWRRLGAVGCSRNVSFMVDGDGNFKPKCQVLNPFAGTYDPGIEENASELATEDGLHYDFDAVAAAMSLVGNVSEGKHVLDRFKKLIEPRIPELQQKCEDNADFARKVRKYLDRVSYPHVYTYDDVTVADALMLEMALRRLEWLPSQR